MPASVWLCVCVCLWQLFSVNSAAFVCAPSCGSVDKPNYRSSLPLKTPFHSSSAEKNRKSELHLLLHSFAPFQAHKMPKVVSREIWKYENNCLGIIAYLVITKV